MKENIYYIRYYLDKILSKFPSTSISLFDNELLYIHLIKNSLSNDLKRKITYNISFLVYLKKIFKIK